MSIANSMRRECATEIPELRSAFIAMAHGITRPKAIRWHLDDAARGRPVRPLGKFPEVAGAIIDNGGSFHSVTKPLHVMLAHLRRRCGKLSGADFREALLKAETESGEARVEALRIGMSMNCLERSVLTTFVQQEREAIQAEEVAVEIAEDKLSEMSQ